MIVRMFEIKECARIIEQALDGLPEGAVHHGRPQVRAAAAPRAGDEHGGADPPLQARHRGLPRAAGRVLLPDRVAARGDGHVRPLRRLLQARARAHARPLVREPAGVPPDGQGPLHRRLHRHARACSTRCWAGSTASAPPMAIDPTRIRRYAHGSRVPGWDDAVDLTKDPADRPRSRHDARARTSCAPRSRST